MMHFCGFIIGFNGLSFFARNTTGRSLFKWKLENFCISWIKPLCGVWVSGALFLYVCGVQAQWEHWDSKGVCYRSTTLKSFKFHCNSWKEWNWWNKYIFTVLSKEDKWVNLELHYFKNLTNGVFQLFPVRNLNCNFPVGQTLDWGAERNQTMYILWFIFENMKWFCLIRLLQTADKSHTDAHNVAWIILPPAKCE